MNRAKAQSGVDYYNSPNPGEAYPGVGDPPKEMPLSFEIMSHVIERSGNGTLGGDRTPVKPAAEDFLGQ